jgi:predicted transposase YbfD/YdcC
MPAHLLGPVIRNHWAIENSLHRVMDMLFRRVQGQNQPRANKFHHHKAYGLQFAPMADG